MGRWSPVATGETPYRYKAPEKGEFSVENRKEGKTTSGVFPFSILFFEKKLERKLLSIFFVDDCVYLVDMTEVDHIVLAKLRRVV